MVLLIRPEPIILHCIQLDNVSQLVRQPLSRMAYRIEYLDLGLRAAADLKRAALSISPDGDEGILADRASVKSATPCHAVPCCHAMLCAFQYIPESIHACDSLTSVNFREGAHGFKRRDELRWCRRLCLLVRCAGNSVEIDPSNRVAGEK